MKSNLTKLERAYVVFRGRLDNLLFGKGAYRQGERDEYAMPTPVGPIRLTVRPNRITCQFASVYGGVLAIGEDDGHSSDRGVFINTGEWEIRVPNGVFALCDPDTIDRIAAQLDRVLHAKPTPAQAKLIIADLKDEYEEAGKYARFLGIAFVRGWMQHLGSHDATVDARKPRPARKTTKAKKPAAKNAKPKRRGRN